MNNKHIISLLLILLYMGCQKSDDEIQSISPEECLIMKTYDKEDAACESRISQNKDLDYLGQKGLSETSKLSFIEFCYSINTELSFFDSIGNSINGRIISKEYKSGNTLATTFNCPECVDSCLDNERARLVIESEYFNIRIDLVTRISNSLPFSNKEEPVTTYVIWSTKNQSSQAIFTMDFENHLDESILPDSSFIKFHQKIRLNDNDYFDIYSNESVFMNDRVKGIERNERIYLSLQNGLIAVRDSLGILWTKELN